MLAGKPRDCFDLFDIMGQKRDRVWHVYIGRNQVERDVYCDMTNGGWTVEYILLTSIRPKIRKGGTLISASPLERFCLLCAYIIIMFAIVV